MDEIILCTRGGGRKEGIASSENAKANGLSTLVQQADILKKEKDVSSIRNAKSIVDISELCSAM
jgi:hypothetical protein